MVRLDRSEGHIDFVARNQLVEFGLIAGLDVEAGFRVALPKGRNHLREHKFAEERWCGDPYHTNLSPPDIIGGALGLVDQAAHALSHARQLGPQRCRGHGAPSPREQIQTCPGFEGFDHAAQRGLGRAEPLSRKRKTAFLDNGSELHQMPGVVLHGRFHTAIVWKHEQK